MSLFKVISFLVYFRTIVVVKAALYGFAFENDEMFDDCPDVPYSVNVLDIGDLSNIEMDYTDGFVSVSGNHTVTWEGVQPTDRIECIAEVYQFRRGAWQPTPFTIIEKDFCKVQFDPTSVWYQVWSKHIPEHLRICFNNYGIMYAYEPFTVDARFNFITFVEGRYKLVGRGFAYDERNLKRKVSLKGVSASEEAVVVLVHS
ncbi:uncharacterized protein LOC133329884 [Musca vetustissima]|uniref:uncharacterized protein LOC133329884 n=1 Tax=Musca vetustissima TaxID=27455 RepID=UPI002AB6FD15|nr:uncharacterized protein LOC133329884 [Musca vetustissima]